MKKIKSILCVFISDLLKCLKKMLSFFNYNIQNIDLNLSKTIEWRMKLNAMNNFVLAMKNFD